MKSQRGSMNMWSVASLGIGSMIGAGIFALLGQATVLAGRDVVFSFAFAGLTALFSGYSYARLASRYPTSEGILAYYAHGFRSPILAGGLSLLYLITLAVSISMLAKTFGIYAAGIYPVNLLLIDRHITGNFFASCIVLLLVWLNMTGSQSVGQAESFIVGVKLFILALLMLSGLPSVQISSIVAEPSVGLLPMLGSVGLTFFAFAGFGMMTNAAGEVKNPGVTIPRAIFLAIGIVIVIYVGLAFVVLGNMPLSDVQRYADTAIAHAAQPMLGAFGFFIVSCAALLATMSGINAMLFSGMRIAHGMAHKRQLPRAFARTAWRNGSWGMVWSVLGVLVITNLFDLRAIANIASLTFLICYLAVFVVNWRLRSVTKSSPLIILCGAFCMSLVLIFFVLTLWRTSLASLLLTALFFCAGFLVEWFLLRGSSGEQVQD